MRRTTSFESVASRILFLLRGLVEPEMYINVQSCSKPTSWVELLHSGEQKWADFGER